jgi:hypothetical protein
LPQLAGSVFVSTQTLLQNVEQDALSVVVPLSKSSKGCVVVAQPRSTQRIEKRKARMAQL